MTHNCSLRLYCFDKIRREQEHARSDPPTQVQSNIVWKHRFGQCFVIRAGLVGPRLQNRWFSPSNEPRLLLVESRGLFEKSATCQRKRGCVSSQSITSIKEKPLKLQTPSKTGPSLKKGDRYNARGAPVVAGR